MGKQTKRGNSVDKGGRKAKEKKNERRREMNKREREKKTKKGVSILSKIYENQIVGLRRRKN